LAGSLPGTTAVVILGDALAGHPGPLLVQVSVCTGALGATGLVIEIRHCWQHRAARSTATSSDDEAAANELIRR
jgi:uncharacterized membrane protein YdjX (TVP38/TMEM64 family)